MREYKLVPLEPTAEMQAAYERASIAPVGPISKNGYKAMLAAAPAVQGGLVDWKDGYRAAMNEAGWAVRELYVNHVHHTGVDGLLKRCQELEQTFICSAEAAPQPAEQPTHVQAQQPAEQRPAPDVAQLVSVSEIIKAVANFVGSQKGGPFTPAVIKAAIIAQLECGDAFTKLLTSQPAEQPECGCCGQADRCDDDCDAVVIGGHRAAEQQPAPQPPKTKEGE